MALFPALAPAGAGACDDSSHSFPANGHTQDEGGAFSVLSPAWKGDPYRAADSTTRGVCLTSVEAPGAHNRLLGCCYGDDEHGAEFGSPGGLLEGVHDFFAGTSTPAGKRSLPCYTEDGQLSADDAESLPGAARPYYSQPFSAAHAPPPRPEDTLWVMEVTTIHLRALRGEPSDIGNAFLAFVREQIRTVNVLKVNLAKYTVKAELSVGEECLFCLAKARIYREKEAGRYALELQRRSGDSLAFHTAFREAVEFFRQDSRFEVECRLESGASRWHREPVLRFEPAQWPCTLSVMEVQPLLDMAEQMCQPWLQAEAASALAGLARNAVAAAALCDSVVFKNIRRLLDCEQLCIAFPTAKLLARLATCAGAAGCFDMSLLTAIVRKVCSDATCDALKVELAEVVRAAVRQSAAKLTAQSRSELAQAVDDAQCKLEDLPLGLQALQDAARTLRTEASR